MHKIPFPACIISGGQTGADRAGLDAAIAHDITVAGYCPRGRKAEDGPIPAAYNLTETESDSYPERTRKNIELADATAIFGDKPAADLVVIRRSGSALTAREAARLRKPCLVLAAFGDVRRDAAELKAWLEVHKPKVLNVAGPRESALPGIYEHTRSVLDAVISAMPAAKDQVPHTYGSRGA